MSMTRTSPMLEYGRRSRRWRWWDSLLLLTAMLVVVFLIWSMVQPTWGIYEIRVNFNRP